MNGKPNEIILIEDNPNDAELIMRVLKKNGLAEKVTILRDGEEAYEYLFHKSDSGSFDANSKILLLDLKLPKIDGLQLLRRIKTDERIRTIPVIVLTSSNEDRDLKEAYESGANSYVTKPIQYAEFSRSIMELGQYWLQLNRQP